MTTSPTGVLPSGTDISWAARHGNGQGNPTMASLPRPPHRRHGRPTRTRPGRWGPRWSPRVAADSDRIRIARLRFFALLRRRAVQGRSSWIDVPPYAARCRFARRLSVHSGRQKAKARRLRAPCHSQCIAHRGACGKTRVVLHNLRPKPEPAEIRELRSTCALVDVWVSAGRRTAGGTRGAVAHSVRRCGCARRRTARSSWPRCNLVEWGVSCLT